jgi:hypothetical protein
MGGFSFLIRAKSMEKMELWVSLLLYARRQARATDGAKNQVSSCCADTDQRPLHLNSGQVP